MSFDLRPRKRAGALHSPFAAFAVPEVPPFARKGLCSLQHDMDVANGSGATVRADFNNAIEALATLSSGASEPGTTYAYQPWADTTSGLLKQRNAANGAWIVRGTLAESFTAARSSNTIIGVADFGKTFNCTSTFTQTLTAAATLGDGFFFRLRNNGSGVITIDPNSTETIDGASTITVQPGESFLVWCTGSAFITIGRININALTADTAALAADFLVAYDASAGGLKKVSTAKLPGQWELINTFTPSAAASQAITGFDSAVYDDYEIVLDRLAPATDNAFPWLRTSSNGGSSYDSGASDYAWATLLSSVADSDLADSEIQLSGAGVGVGSAADEVLSGTVRVINPGAAAQCRMHWQVGFTDSAPLERQATGSGRRLASTDVDAMQFLFSTGNIASGTIRLYGRRKPA